MLSSYWVSGSKHLLHFETGTPEDHDCFLGTDPGCTSVGLKNYEIVEVGWIAK